MSDGSSYYINCETCGRENHPQQTRCWVCGYPLTSLVKTELHQPAPNHGANRPSRSGWGTVLGTLFIALGGVFGGLLIGIFLVIALIVAMFAACIEICTSGSAILFF